MIQQKFRFGWVVAVVAMVTLACTCGGLSQAQGQLQTAQAVATGIATSGAIETLQALSTEQPTSQSGDNGGNVGAVPDNIPVMDGAKDVVAAGGAVTYTVPADLTTAVDFYSSGMVDKGWKESQPKVELAGVATVLTYTNDDNQEAVVTLTAQGSDTLVAIAVK